MVAEPGKTYALVVKGRCCQVFTRNTLPEWHDGLQVVDVTANPPSVGDVFNGVSFTPPPAPPAPPARKRTELDMLLDYVATKPDAPQEIQDAALDRMIKRGG